MSNKYHAQFGELVDGSLENIEQGWSERIHIIYYVNNDKRKVTVEIKGENIEEDEQD